jgi:hypothetical protein
MAPPLRRLRRTTHRSPHRRKSFAPGPFVTRVPRARKVPLEQRTTVAAPVGFGADANHSHRAKRRLRKVLIRKRRIPLHAPGRGRSRLSAQIPIARAQFLAPRALFRDRDSPHTGDARARHDTAESPAASQVYLARETKELPYQRPVAATLVSLNLPWREQLRQPAAQ